MATIDKAKQYKNSVSDLYNKVAPIYDQIGPAIFSHFGQRLVDEAKISNGAKVLDIGSGRGASLFPAAERVGQEGLVIGIDLSPIMVAETAKEIESQGLKNVQIIQMDAEQLEFPDAAFDFVLCGYTIFWFTDIIKSLSEVNRVMTSGGTYAITMSSTDDMQWWTWFMDLLYRYNEIHPLFTDSLGTNSVNRDPKALEIALLRAGFSDVRTITETTRFIYRSKDDWWNSLWSQATRIPLEKMPTELLEQFKQDVYKNLSSFKDENGYWWPWSTHFTLAKKADSN